MSTEQKKAMEDMKDAGKQLEFDVDVKPTGQQKAIAGQDAREFLVTITMRQQGMKVEESGGLVATSNVWMAPRIAALDEMHEFNMKFVKAVYGEMFGNFNPQQMGAMSAMIPGLGTLMQRIRDEDGISVVFIEQNVELALSLADRGTILESGRTVLSGPSAELLQSVEVKRIFLGDVAF